MKTECLKYLRYAALLSLILTGVLSLAGCTNPEKAKAEHVSRGEAYLKESSFRKLDSFRNAAKLTKTIPSTLGLSVLWGLQRGQSLRELVDGPARRQ